MDLNLINTKYYPRKKQIGIHLEMNHELYGVLKCRFIFNPKKDVIYLTQTTVKEKVIPVNEHQNLMGEIRKNEELKDIVKSFGFRALDEKKISMSESSRRDESPLHLNYTKVKEATTYYVQDITRIGKNLSSIKEEEYEEHSIVSTVKFVEYEEEFSFSIKYKNGDYRINPIKGSRSIEKYLTDKVRKNILDSIKSEVNFYLP